MGAQYYMTSHHVVVVAMPVRVFEAERAPTLERGR
jgi:hypothetical protein